MMAWRQRHDADCRARDQGQRPPTETEAFVLKAAERVLGLARPGRWQVWSDPSDYDGYIIGASLWRRDMAIGVRRLIIGIGPDPGTDFTVTIWTPDGKRELGKIETTRFGAAARLGASAFAALDKQAVDGRSRALGG